MLTEKQIIAKYGKPGTSIVSMALPYKMRIAWDLKTSVSTMQCHKLMIPRFETVFKGLLTIYGLPELQKLGIDIFGGCYNYRQMRGGTSWSRHSWGIAIDLDPVRNALKTSWLKSQFSKPEYALMVELFYRNGFFNLGKEKNYDSMHFETSI